MNQNYALPAGTESAFIDKGMTTYNNNSPQKKMRKTLMIIFEDFEASRCSNNV